MVSKSAVLTILSLLLFLVYAHASSPPTSFRSKALVIENTLPEHESSTAFQSKLYSKSIPSSSAKVAKKSQDDNDDDDDDRDSHESSRHTSGAVSGAIGSVAITPILIEGFSRLGAYMINFGRLQYPQVPRGVTEMTIVFHGVNGQDEFTTLLMTSLNKTSSPFNYLMNWEYYSKNMAQAPFNGERIGREVARRLPARIRLIHVIGVSAGAHAADACVRQLKKDRRDRIYVQETLLNPVCARGLLDLEYGEREFGSVADYAQHFLNRNDDALSFSSSPCLKCAVFDVTLRRPSTISSGQEWWPLIFYSTRFSDRGFVDDSNKLGRGVVIVLE